MATRILESSDGAMVGDGEAPQRKRDYPVHNHKEASLRTDRCWEDSGNKG